MYEKNYRWHLLKYAGAGTRYRCPACGRPRCFTPYVDDDGVPADVEQYGRCDHESSCGYNLYPPSSEDFRQGENSLAMRKFEKRPIKRPSASKTAPCSIPEDIVARTVVFSSKNAFIAFLLRLFPRETVKSLIEMYSIGTTRDGHTIFYEIDSENRVRSGKIIPYDPETGHRVKDGSVPEAMWVHTKLKALHKLPEDWTLTQCLFGEHLLKRYPDRAVAIVESEKTAVICAAQFPEYLWLATGSKQQFNDRLLVLRGRKVIAFPDVDAYDLWLQKARDYPLLDITISDLLERTATPEQRERKIDIADLVVEERMKLTKVE